MEFGLFVQGYIPGPGAHDPRREHEALTREMELVQAADRHGWKFAWLTEHHGLTEYSHLAANEVHAGFLAACTNRIHIGAGIFNISPRANHPVKVAEKVATLDHLTNRRFEFGTGRGAGSHEVATFGIDDKESTRAEYDEVIREILRMWEQKDYTFEGEHFSMPVPHNVLPKPYGPGHPPFWLAVGSPATWKKAGLLGQGALGFTFSSIHDLEPRIADYKAGISECTDPVGQFVNDNAMVTSAVNCSADRARARDQATRFGANYLMTMVSLYHDTMPRPGVPAWPAPPAGIRDDEIDDLVRGGFLLCGTPEEVCEQLAAYERIGVDQVCFGVPNNSSYDEALEMIELFGKHVIPEYDRRPDVVSTDEYRSEAVPKFPVFNQAPVPIETIWTASRVEVRDPAKETAMRPTDHYIVISSDCHAGGSHAQYREYLASEWRDEFDAWRGKYSNPFRDLQGDGRTRNWDGERRIADQDAEGVVAEVIFPNTVPPFFPTGSVIAPAPSPEEYPARLAGIRAHNRWLADFVAEQPHRRAGLTQIFLNDVDDALEDIAWGQEHGLVGVMLPGVSPDTPWIEPLFSPRYDPIWSLCQDLDISVTHHGGGSGVPKLPRVPSATIQYVMEAGFWANRALWHLTMSGVFERFPGLTLALTEQGTSWVPEVLDRMDALHADMREHGRIGELGVDPEAILPHRPSDYFRRNVMIGAAFPAPSDAVAMRKLGLDRIMWGSDYPHMEACSPHSRESLRRTFAGWKPEELNLVLAENAARVYGFDLSKLRPIADRVGPTVEEVATPLTELPDNQSPAFSRQ